MMDPETGACMGCGRLPDESAGAPQPVPKTSERIPLPPQVAAEAQNPTD
jgi:hypothetical protein